MTTANEPRIEIDGEVTRRIRQHARAHLKTEVCGVLIGDDLSGTIEIRAAIQASSAAQGGTHVTFTQDAWEEIYKVKDEQYPDERIVGWYHSHPGFGVFLSEHDLFIQQNFFSSPGQVAWVYDPHTDEEGCFGWVAGKVKRLSTLNVVDRSGPSVDHSAKTLTNYADPTDEADESEAETRSAPARKPAETKTSRLLRWTGIFFSHAAAIMIGFAVAYFIFPRIIALTVNPATGQVEMHDGRALMERLLDEENEAARSPKASPAPAPADPNQGSHP